MRNPSVAFLVLMPFLLLLLFALWRLDTPERVAVPAIEPSQDRPQGVPPTEDGRAHRYSETARATAYPTGWHQRLTEKVTADELAVMEEEASKVETSRPERPRSRFEYPTKGHFRNASREITFDVLVRANGEPVENARVVGHVVGISDNRNLLQRLGGEKEHEAGPYYLSGPDGVVKVTTRIPKVLRQHEPVMVAAYHPEHGTATVETALELLELGQQVIVDLDVGITIVGRVLAQSGQPLIGARITRGKIASQESPNNLQAFTDKEDRFVLRGIQEVDGCRIFFSHEGYSEDLDSVYRISGLEHIHFETQSSYYDLGDVALELRVTNLGPEYHGETEADIARARGYKKEHVVRFDDAGKYIIPTERRLDLEAGVARHGPPRMNGKRRAEIEATRFPPEMIPKKHGGTMEDRRP